MAENIKTRKYYRMHNGTDWDRMHFVTDANSVDANDGDTMETKVGAIKGITTSTAVTEEGYAADATTVAALNSSLGKVNVYVGSDKKIHFVNSAGADSVLPFNSGISSYTSVYSTSNVGSASFTGAEVGKIYLLIGTIRWKSDGAISFSGFQEIFGTTKSVLSSGMSWWQAYYIKIVKATSTTINATFSNSSDASKSALEIYKLS